MKTILITGGAGFIGRHLCKHFIDNTNHRVVCIDNLYSGQYSNIQQFIDNDRFKFIRGDVRDRWMLDNQLCNYKFDQIYNLACPASPIHYQKKPILTLQTCFQGTKNILDIATKDGSVFFQASTSQVYGDPEIHPQVQEYYGNVNPIGVRSCYDQGKRVAQSLCVNYKNKFGTKIRIGRLFNTYGAFMATNDGRVVSQFVVNALNGEDLMVNGNGNQTRSFCYINDTIKMILALVKSHYQFPVNIGNPTEITINEVAILILSNINTSSKIQYLQSLENDPKKRKPNIDKITDILQTNMEFIPFDKGIQNVIDYFRTL